MEPPDTWLAMAPARIREKTQAPKDEKSEGELSASGPQRPPWNSQGDALVLAKGI